MICEKSFRFGWEIMGNHGKSWEIMGNHGKQITNWGKLGTESQKFWDVG